MVSLATVESSRPIRRLQPAPAVQRLHPVSLDRPAVLDLGAAARRVQCERIARRHRHWDEVSRLAMSRRGWTDEDLHQEVLAKLIERQTMGSAYDPDRGGVATYLGVAIGGILADIRATLKRLRDGAPELKLVPLEHAGDQAAAVPPEAVVLSVIEQLRRQPGTRHEVRTRVRQARGLLTCRLRPDEVEPAVAAAVRAALRSS